MVVPEAGKQVQFLEGAHSTIFNITHPGGGGGGGCNYGESGGSPGGATIKDLVVAAVEESEVSMLRW